MGYCTVAQVRSSLGGVVEAELSTAHIEEAINEASSLMDSYLYVRYLLPILEPYPYMLTRICRRLCACWLNEDAVAGGTVYIDEEKAQTLCDNALLMLESYRDGKIVLVYPDNVGVSPNPDGLKTAWSNSTDYNHPQFFDKDSELNWKYSDDELDDIAGERD